MKKSTMNDDTLASEEKRSIWLRGLSMILMGVAHQVTGTMLLFLASVQFIVALLGDSPNARLSGFGCSLEI